MRRFSLLLIFVWLGISGNLFAQIIGKITFVGNRKVETATLTNQLGSKKGTFPSRRQIKRDVHNLFDLGYFEDIKVTQKAYQDTQDEKIELIFYVKEKPSIANIVFEGMEEFEDDHFNDLIMVKQYTIVNERNIFEDLQTIRKEYVEKGFYLVDVRYHLEEVSSNEVILKYIVKENNKVKVREINFIGNKAFSDDELKSKLAIREFDRNSWMTSAGVYKEEFFDRDTRFLEFFYMDNGYVRVKVNKPQVFLSPDKQWIDITYAIKEGEQYYISSLDIDGDILTTKEDLLKLVKSKPGKLFRHSVFTQDIVTLTDYYGDFGYAFVNVTPATPIDEANRKIALKFSIQKGEKVYFGNIEIKGNDKTRDNVIRRQLLIAEGALYSGSKLKDSKTKVERLGFFEEVQVKTQKDLNNKKVNVTIKIKEKTTGNFQLGVGYSGYQSFFFTGQISENNVFGYGQRVGIETQYNDEEHRLSFSWREPYLMDTQWNLGASLTKSLQKGYPLARDSDPFKENKIGGRLSLGHTVFRDTILHVAYKLERIRYVNVIDYYRFKFPDALTSSVDLTLERDTTNNYIDPTRGMKLSTSLEYAGNFLGGDQDYVKWMNQGTYYYPIKLSDYWRTYFRFNAQHGHVFPNSNKIVPVSERFNLGGIKSNRGYGWFKISKFMEIIPDPFSFPIEIRKGGDRFVQFNLEYYFPLIAEAGLKGLCFFDASQVFDDKEKFTLNSLKYGVGCGIRWLTPIAPLRFELGWPYYPDKNKLGEKIPHFYIGF